MKVLIADKLPASGLEAFTAAGFELLSQPALAGDELVQRIAESGADVLLIRSTKVPRAALEAGSLGLVVRAGAGYNNVDVAAAAQLGIYVANCPGKNAIAVAELTWGLILSLDRRIPDATRQLRAGHWNKKEFAKAEGLFGKTLGLLGLGNIGREVARRAAGFGMPVVAWSRSLTPERAEALGVGFAATPLDVAKRADVLSVHVALNDDTRRMVGRQLLEALPPGSFLVNTSRGGVVDAEALTWAVTERGIRAGLDVWAVQPSSGVAEFEDPLGSLDGVCGTPHIGASTQQAQDAVAAEALRVARVYRDTGEVPNCVNIAVRSDSPCALVVRHLDRVGVLAFILDALRESNLNVHEMQNRLFAGDNAAACATIHVSARPDGALLAKLRAHDPILSVQVTA